MSLISINNRLEQVQTGFGRLGDAYWGFQTHDVLPDIVTLAKGIGNGFPLAAVVTSKEIAQVMSRAIHFNTYGGNPLASAVGVSVLDAIEEDGCQRISKDVGTYFLTELGKVKDDYQVTIATLLAIHSGLIVRRRRPRQGVDDWRGDGGRQGEQEAPAGREIRRALGRLQGRRGKKWPSQASLIVPKGLLGKGGLYRNVLRIKPPMCIDKADVDYSIKVLRWALGKNGLK